MILSAVRISHAHSKVDILKDNPDIGESGFHAWKSLKDWLFCVSDFKNIKFGDQCCK